MLQYLSSSYLTATVELPQQRILIAIGFFFVLIVAGFLVHFFVSKKPMPRFYKRFLKWCGDFLIYMPIVLIFIFIIILIGFSIPNYFLVATLLIWLIWFLFLVYYRIVKVSKLWYKYQELKQKEKYQKNGRENK